MNIETVSYKHCKTEGCRHFVATNSGTNGLCPTCHHQQKINEAQERDKNKVQPPPPERYSNPECKTVSQLPWYRSNGHYVLRCVFRSEIRIYSTPHPTEDRYDYYWEICSSDTNQSLQNSRKPSFTWAAAGMHALQNFKKMISYSPQTSYFECIPEEDKAKKGVLG